MSVQIILPFRHERTSRHEAFKSRHFAALVFLMSGQRMRIFVLFVANETGIAAT